MASGFDDSHSRAGRGAAAGIAVVDNADAVAAFLVDEGEVVLGIAFAPGGKGAHHHPQGVAFGCEQVFSAGRMLAVEASLKDPFTFEELQAVGQEAGGDPLD